jgi:hypothetical protein
VKRQRAEESSVPLLLDHAAKLLDKVVDAAGRAEQEIRAESEALHPPSRPGAGGSGERIVADLTGTLLERAKGLREDAEELSRILERARLCLTDAEAPSPSTPQGRARGQAPSEPPAAGETAADGSAKPVAAGIATEAVAAGVEPSGGRFVGKAARVRQPQNASTGRVSDGVRLIAIQMAVAGSSAEEIGEHLRREFHIADPSGILAEVLGPGARR